MAAIRGADEWQEGKKNRKERERDRERELKRDK